MVPKCNPMVAQLAVSALYGKQVDFLSRVDFRVVDIRVFRTGSEGKRLVVSWVGGPEKFNSEIRSQQGNKEIRRRREHRCTVCDRFEILMSSASNAQEQEPSLRCTIMMRRKR